MRPIVATALTLLLLSAGSVGATPIECTADNPCRLVDLVAAPEGEGFLSGDGNVFFSNFEAIATGAVVDLFADPDGVVVAATGSGFGFDLVGGFSANAGEIGDLLVRFDMEVLNSTITAALLSFNGSASGLGAGASVTETFDGISDGQLFVYVIGGDNTGSGDPVTLLNAVDSLELQFLPGQTLRVTKDIIVDSTVLAGQLPGNAQISQITQQFIPEPATGLLVLLGVAGALLLRVRRS